MVNKHESKDESQPTGKSDPHCQAGSAKTSEAGALNESKRPRVDWEDPSIPVGNAPPLPRWPLTVAGIAWLAFVVFLMVMMVNVE